MARTIRIILGEYFQSPMSNMNFPAYFNYVNTAGKITARSTMDLITILSTALEEQEKINVENEENFKTIFEILTKLVKQDANLTKEPISEPSSPEEKELEDALPKSIKKTPEFKLTPNSLKCGVCGKVCKNKFGYNGHMTSHQSKV